MMKQVKQILKEKTYFPNYFLKNEEHSYKSDCLKTVETKKNIIEKYDVFEIIDILLNDEDFYEKNYQMKYTYNEVVFYSKEDNYFFRLLRLDNPYPYDYVGSDYFVYQDDSELSEEEINEMLECNISFESEKEVLDENVKMEDFKNITLLPFEFQVGTYLREAEDLFSNFLIQENESLKTMHEYIEHSQYCGALLMKDNVTTFMSENVTVIQEEGSDRITFYAPKGFERVNWAGDENAEFKRNVLIPYYISESREKEKNALKKAIEIFSEEEIKEDDFKLVVDDVYNIYGKDNLYWLCHVNDDNQLPLFEAENLW